MISKWRDTDITARDYPYSLVMKLSMASGHAGVDNPLFYKDNYRMLFGDAKKMLDEVLAALQGVLKNLGHFRFQGSSRGGGVGGAGGGKHLPAPCLFQRRTHVLNVNRPGYRFRDARSGRRTSGPVTLGL